MSCAGSGWKTVVLCHILLLLRSILTLLYSAPQVHTATSSTLNSMELSDSLLYRLCLPTDAFVDPDTYFEDSDLDGNEDRNTSLEAWKNSALNPSNRIETFDSPPIPRWRIDGAIN